MLDRYKIPYPQFYCVSRPRREATALYSVQFGQVPAILGPILCAGQSHDLGVFCLDAGVRTGDSEMLYPAFPRTFDLTDVTGVMDTCDRHMGTIAMRVLVIVSCLSTVLCAWCLRIGSLAIAAYFCVRS